MKITALSCSEYLLPDFMGLVLFGIFLLELLKKQYIPLFGTAYSIHSRILLAEKLMLRLAALVLHPSFVYRLWAFLDLETRLKYFKEVLLQLF